MDNSTMEVDEPCISTKKDERPKRKIVLSQKFNDFVMLTMTKPNNVNEPKTWQEALASNYKTQ